MCIFHYRNIEKKNHQFVLFYFNHSRIASIDDAESR